MPAERLEPEDGTERCEREFLTDARARIEAFMTDAGLTESEHHVYWWRVGYLWRWSEIAQVVHASRRVQRPPSSTQLSRRFVAAEGKLRALVIARRMVESPLHPWNNHATFHGHADEAETLAAQDMQDCR